MHTVQSRSKVLVDERWGEGNACSTAWPAMGVPALLGRDSQDVICSCLLGEAIANAV
jgi:hypothetical protein